MTITELIAALQVVQAEHGDAVQIAVFRDGDCERLDDTKPPEVQDMRMCGLYRRAYVEPDDRFAIGSTVKVLAL